MMEENIWFLEERIRNVLWMWRLGAEPPQLSDPSNCLWIVARGSLCLSVPSAGTILL